MKKNLMIFMNKIINLKIITHGFRENYKKVKLLKIL